MNNNSNKKQIRELIKSWELAIQSGNIKNIFANYTKNILMFDVPEPLQSKGIEAYKKTWNLFFKYGSPSKKVFVIQDLKITAGEDVAFATALLKIGGGNEAYMSPHTRLQESERQLAHCSRASFCTAQA